VGEVGDKVGAGVGSGVGGVGVQPVCNALMMPSCEPTKRVVPSRDKVGGAFEAPPGKSQKTDPSAVLSATMPSGDETNNKDPSGERECVLGWPQPPIALLPEKVHTREPSSVRSAQT
jgi:hypothetical protein